MARPVDPARRYQADQPCGMGHVGERYKSNSQCVACTTERRNRLFAERGDIYRANRRKKYAEDSEYRAEINAKNQAAHARQASERNANKRRRWATDPEYRQRMLDSAERGRAKRKDAIRAYFRKRYYGLSEARFRAMLAEQDARCKICRSDGPLNVDHCHATGRVRGLLCTPCNQGLGRFRDDPALLGVAARYLEAQT